MLAIPPTAIENTDDVGVVLFQSVEEVSTALVDSNLKNFPAPCV